MRLVVAILLISLLAACTSVQAPSRARTVGDILAALPKNDAQFRIVMREANLSSVKLGMNLQSFKHVLAQSNQPFEVHEDGTFIITPMSQDRVQMAKALLVSFENDEVESIILSYEGGLSYVSVR